MSVISDRYVASSSLSKAWLDAVRLIRQSRKTKAVHLVIRIAEPPVEVPEIRAAVDHLIEEAGKEFPRGLPPVDTTRTTIFPAAWARSRPEPSDLAAYYRTRYPELRKFPDNKFGTYFGRIVAYPRTVKHGGEDYGDQLTELVRKLRLEMQKGMRSSRYEVNVFSERYDTNAESFPCLAHLSFHLHEGALHLQAVYRNEYLVGRAYGNYLGLGELQRYVAVACGLAVGELMVSVNHVELDAPVKLVDRVLAQLAPY